MNLTRCENGHFYDAERFDACPHCNQTSVSTVLEGPDGEKEYTMPLNVDPVPGGGLGSIISEVSETEDGSQVTIGYFGAVQTEPVVGWLVAIEGSNYGEDFKLKTGRNFIGRASNMDVSLNGDSSISREKHAIILYEPKSNVFLVQPGEAKELFYLNDKVVLTATEINAYDVLSLGATKLLFIPCCSDKFQWDKANSDAEQK